MELTTTEVDLVASLVAIHLAEMYDDYKNEPSEALRNQIALARTAYSNLHRKLKPNVYV